MKKEKDGGPAFPQNTFQKVGDVAVGECKPGMTLRDYIAAAALQGLLAGSTGSINAKWIDATATDCFAIADAMLKAREA